MTRVVVRPSRIINSAALGGSAGAKPCWVLAAQQLRRNPTQTAVEALGVDVDQEDVEQLVDGAEIDTGLLGALVIAALRRVGEGRAGQRMKQHGIQGAKHPLDARLELRRLHRRVLQDHPQQQAGVGQIMADEFLAVVNDQGGRQAIGQPRVFGAVQLAHIPFGLDRVMQTFHDGEIAGWLKAEVIAQRVTGRGIQAVRQRQTAQWQVIAIIDDDEIRTGVVDFDPFQRPIGIRCLAVLGGGALGSALAAPLALFLAQIGGRNPARQRGAGGEHKLVLWGTHAVLLDQPHSQFMLHVVNRDLLLDFVLILDRGDSQGFDLGTQPGRVCAAAGPHRRNQGAQVMAAAGVSAQPAVDRSHTQRVVPSCAHHLRTGSL